MKSMFKSKIATYILLTFGVSYGYALVYYLAGGRIDEPRWVIFAVGYMYIPAVCSVILQKIVYKEPLAELGLTFCIKKYWLWFLSAWILPVAFASATIPSSLLMPGVAFSPELEGLLEKYRNLLPPEEILRMRDSLETMPINPFFLGVLLALGAGISINAIAAFGEELGWRGFLFKQIEKWGFWKASATTGILWGLWHLPFIIQGYNYPEHRFIGVLMMTVFTLLLSPAMHLIRIKTKSVFSSAIFHGTINASVGLPMMLIQGGNDLTVGVMGIAGFLVLALINFAIYLYLMCGKESVLSRRLCFF